MEAGVTVLDLPYTPPSSVAKDVLYTVALVAVPCKFYEGLWLSIHAVNIAVSVSLSPPWLVV